MQKVIQIWILLQEINTKKKFTNELYNNIPLISMLLFLLGINVHKGRWHKESQMFMLAVHFLWRLSHFKPQVYKVMKDLSIETKT